MNDSATGAPSEPCPHLDTDMTFKNLPDLDHAGDVDGTLTGEPQLFIPSHWIQHRFPYLNGFVVLWILWVQFQMEACCPTVLQFLPQYQRLQLVWIRRLNLQP